MSGPRRSVLAVAFILQGIVLSWSSSSWSADHEQLPTTVAAVVDYQRVLQEAAASKSIAEQMNVRRKAYHDEIAKEEQRLYEAERELAKQRSVLSEDAVNAKQKELEAEVQAVRELTQKRRQQLEQVSADAVSKVERALFEVLTTIAEQRGLNVVLPTSQVLFFSRQIDLTDEVLAQLDATLSEVPVTDRVD
ncbi:MAG: OmpH family outer membrane protein [Alphaproteobacteria bacterium]|nr:OmpH family outer membrane protein [Alphaproteobacteria bacterium]